MKLWLWHEFRLTVNIDGHEIDSAKIGTGNHARGPNGINLTCVCKIFTVRIYCTSWMSTVGEHTIYILFLHTVFESGREDSLLPIQIRSLRVGFSSSQTL